jgi:hypothetical protein
MRAEHTSAPDGAALSIAHLWRGRAGAAFACFAVALLAAGDVRAQPLPATPPMPPPRPVMPYDPPKTPPPPQMEPTAPMPAERAREAPAPQPAAPAPVDPHAAHGVDRNLLRACAIEWERMKSSGAAAGKIWRDFASECVLRNGQPK